MPKRIIDGEAIWTSRRLRGLGVDALPALYYTWLLPLATGNGSFECDPELICRSCFSWFSEWNITVEDISELLQLYESNGLVFRWTQDGRSYGYWAGIEKPGRLPKQSLIQRSHVVCGPKPPQKELRAYLRKHGWTVERHGSDTGAPMIPLGSGSGSGSGSGKERTESRASFFAGQVLKLTKSEHEAFLKAYPWIDLEAEYRKMDAWLVANNRCLKRPAQFAQNWLSRTPKDIRMGSAQRRKFPKAQVPY